MPLIPFGRERGSDPTAGPLKLRPWRTIFRDKEHGWSPLLWVAYLGFFFIDPVMSHASFRIWLLDGIGAAAFLVLYFGLFVLEHPRALVHVGGMMLLGLLFQPINQGSCTFFIFAAAMLPFCVETQIAAFAGLGAIGTIGAIDGILFHVAGWRLFTLRSFR